MQDLIINMEHVTKLYKHVPALQDVGMKVERGAVYGLVGSNGAGKSTLMRIITGQTVKDSGELVLFGKRPEGREQRVRHRIGSLIEEPGFFGDMTGAQNLEYFRIQFGVPEKQRVGQILQTVGLADTGKKKFKHYSMGMKQRLGLGLALLHTPELLILDEPINGLDPEGILEIRSILMRLNREQNMTILISSHILAELENIATVYGFITHGKLVEQITAKELEKKCGTYIDLETSDVNRMCVILEKEFGVTGYQVYPDGHIHIFRTDDCREAISRSVIANGLSLKSIGYKTMDLETYYMSVCGRTEA